ncbi:DNA polymerase B [Pseudomonas phage MiCath]|uniref:DNA polymerase B n=1 Tax=Pseudomonas phage MiCath TaxID=3003729 RepID=A0AAE9VGL9_9CAUD|nr:DNA polymerase B [Pseudomonas phage MiCath]WAX22414.1 DNA polymerase B [Pseudomonas phage MiCath]
MRKDSLGLFWRDEPPPPRIKAEKIKRTPPDPIWLRPDYLPGLEEALAFDIKIMDDKELMAAAARKDELMFDIECYVNYFIASFRSYTTGQCIFFEMYDGHPLNKNKLRWVLRNFTTVGFNSISYDMIITLLALDDVPCNLLKEATADIIENGKRGSDVLKAHKCKWENFDHIDLIEIAPLRASLKIYGGRLHTPGMQDLPFAPATVLSPEQMAITRWYNINSDLTATAFLRNCLEEQIKLRVQLSNETGMDLRSKSDAQIAEAIVGMELTKVMGRRPQRPKIPIGTSYKYKVPRFIRYQSQLLNWALERVKGANFVVDETGSIGMPEEVANLKLDINGTVYTMGIGGLHSTEKSTAHVCDEDSEYELWDKDVTSYYPYIILILGLFPQHLGQAFLRVYRSIVERRVDAKNKGLKAIANSLKIVVNGMFGKLGSQWSIVYSPDLLVQVTITGQLSLLMLIERLELAGIHVVSANTDGIVIKCKKNMRDIMDTIIAGWEKDTGFGTEGVQYKALYSRDVNNYMAVKMDNTVKCKGAYSNPWVTAKDASEKLHKNPTTTICVDAVEAYLTKGVPLMTTLTASRDITKFITVRSVNGGAVKVWGETAPAHSTKEQLLKACGFYINGKNSWSHKDIVMDPAYPEPRELDADKAYAYALGMFPPAHTEFLGKAIRWYYAKDMDGELVYAKNGNKVPKSDGAKPLMKLPEQFPDDIDYQWYEEECNKMLKAMGVLLEAA